MMYYWILDDDNNPIETDLEQWAKWMESADRRVALDEIAEQRISTVFHQYGDGPPLLFETMTFGAGDEDDTERYSTYAEALAGHQRAVERVRNKAS